MGNSIVSGLSKSPDSATQGVSQKTKQQIEQAKNTGQSIDPEVAQQYMQEVVAAKSKGGAVDLTLANADGGWTISGAGYNDAFVSHRAFDDYSSLVSARTGLAENFGSAWSGSATGRGLNLAFMQAQSESIRNTLSTPITESAAYISGNRRGYVNASVGREGVLASYRYQKASMSQFIAQNQAQYNYELANPMGGWGDVVLGMGQGFVDSLYQGVQFLGTSVAALTPLGQGISYATGNGALNPFDVEYHSMFNAPTTRMQAAGRFMGEVASVFAGGEGVLLAGANVSSKFGSRLNRVNEEFAGGTNSYIDDLSPYTGKRVRNGNRAINSIITEDFSNLNLMYTPKFSPYASSGVTGYASHFKNPGVQIGSKSLESRATLRDTVVHEELHNRWRYKKGVVNNHHYPGKGAYPSDLKYRDMKFYTTVERYKRMRGWEYNKNWVNEWSNYVNSSAINRKLIINNHR